jgi:hypothetical protein
MAVWSLGLNPAFRCFDLVQINVGARVDKQLYSKALRRFSSLLDFEYKQLWRSFKVCLERLVTAGLSPNRAVQVLATITGAMVVANALDDIAAYDRATRALMREPDPKPH